MTDDDEPRGTDETPEGPPEFEGGDPGVEAAPGAGGDASPPRTGSTDAADDD